MSCPICLYRLYQKSYTDCRVTLIFHESLYINLRGKPTFLRDCLWDIIYVILSEEVNSSFSAVAVLSRISWMLSKLTEVYLCWTNNFTSFIFIWCIFHTIRCVSICYIYYILCAVCTNIFIHITYMCSLLYAWSYMYEYYIGIYNVCTIYIIYCMCIIVLHIYMYCTFVYIYKVCISGIPRYVYSI